MLIEQLEMKTAMLVLVRVDESCYSRALSVKTPTFSGCYYDK